MKLEFSSQLYKASGLTPVVFMLLMIYEADEGIPDVEVSKLFNFTIKNVSRWRQVLVEEGYLAKKPDRKRGVNAYVFTDKLKNLNYKIK